MVKLTLSLEDQIIFIELGMCLDKIIAAGELYNLTCDDCQERIFSYEPVHKNWKSIGKCTICENKSVQISNPHIVEFFLAQHGIDFSKVSEANFALYIQYRLLLGKLIKDSKGKYETPDSVKNPLIHQL